jgi:hypothetical protein
LFTAFTFGHDFLEMAVGEGVGVEREREIAVSKRASRGKIMASPYLSSHMGQADIVLHSNSIVQLSFSAGGIQTGIPPSSTDMSHLKCTGGRMADRIQEQI